MLSSELRSRQLKLEAEVRARSEKERQRLERERALQERQRQRLAAREEEKRKQREEQRAAEIAERERIYHETEANRGVYLKAVLQALPVEQGYAQQRGIKRSSDKITLPPSIGSQLLAQDAPKNGPMLFELRSASGATTHAGLLEFSAPEGTVGLPPQVVNNLWPEGGECAGHISVTYRRLEKGEYVRFQPLQRGFHEAVGDEVREVLEQCLLTHCTLSEGDVIPVQVADATLHLKVLELRPGPAVSIIDTDVEAEVVPSLETEEYIRKMEEQRLADSARLQAQAAQRQAAEAAAQAQAAATLAAQAEARQRSAAEAEARLAPEVAPDCGLPYVTCLVRLPDGQRVSRRFLLADRLAALFDFVDSKGGGGLEPGSYQLVAQFPRRQFEPGSESGERSLEECGLGVGQEAFFVEALQQQQQQVVE